MIEIGQKFRVTSSQEVRNNGKLLARYLPHPPGEPGFPLEYRATERNIKLVRDMETAGVASVADGAPAAPTGAAVAIGSGTAKLTGKIKTTSKGTK